MAAEFPGLNERQRRFVLAYATSGNATASALEAGYSPNSAAQQAHALLRNPKVAAALRAHAETADRARVMSRDDLQGWLTETILGSKTKKTVKVDGEWGEIEAVPDMPSRLRAAELLARTSGWMIEQVEHRGSLDLRQGFDAASAMLRDAPEAALELATHYVEKARQAKPS